MKKFIFNKARLSLSILCLSLPFISTYSNAELHPTLANDSRIQYFAYTPDDVFVIKTKMGNSSLIQFEDGEIITDDGGLGMGDSRSWSLGVKGSNIFFKPKENAETTNMTVVTNKRTYAFILKPTNGNDVTYVARFKYPDPELNNDSDKTNKPKSFSLRQTNDSLTKDGKKIYIDSRINVHYFKKGDSQIAPTNVWDDNLFTYLKYDNADDLPTVYKVLPDGTETLVNTHVKDNVLVVHEVTPTLRLRLSKLVVDLQNANKQPTTFNESGTSQDNLIRTIK